MSNMDTMAELRRLIDRLDERGIEETLEFLRWRLGRGKELSEEDLARILHADRELAQGGRAVTKVLWRPAD
jgi:hypothetical protein